MKHRNRSERQGINMCHVLEVIEQHISRRNWRLTERFIKEINRVVLDGIPGEYYSAGEFKSRQNVVLDGLRRIVFTPPPPSETRLLVSHLIGELNRRIVSLRADRPGALPPIFIASIACSRLNYIHPFSHGNGRTSRAVSTMILMGFGYTALPLARDDCRTIIPVQTLEWYFDQHPSDYYAGLQAARRGNWRIWTEVFAEAVEATMKSTNYGGLRLPRGSF